MSTYPDRGDGRKVHYGPGRQPVDTIRDMGWAPEFFAGNVLKYLRRSKDIEHSHESARVYFRWLGDEVKSMQFDEAYRFRALDVLERLCAVLTLDERKILVVP